MAAERPLLRIRLLGGFAVAGPAGAVDDGAWRLRKGRALVKLVAVSPEHRVHREQAAEALWPDRDARAARNNFHQALHAARRALDSAGADGAAALPLVDDVLALGPDVEVDLDAFDAAVAAARASGEPADGWAAVEAHSGELLPEDRYEAWAQPRREAVRDAHLALCLEVSRIHSERGELSEAVRAAHAALATDPLDQPAHRALMQLHARLGRRQQALALYGQLRERLEHELAAEPDEATRALYRRLLAGHEEQRPPAATNLPRRLTSFVGRELEGEEIGRLLSRVGLLTLTGPGGCGKTRLALEVARGRLGAHPGGVWLVELAPLSDPARVADACANALGLRIPARRSVLDVLRAHLAGREALLVVDNCEHLVEAVARLVEYLLGACPGLRVLATSREPLRCSGEVTWRVPSLSLPADDDLERSEAARLFLERAGAGAGAGQAALVAQLCRRLDGMPLAIELAAARTAFLSLEQIVERLDESLDVLGGGSRTALTRQQTLRAAIAWSHDLLDRDERALFARLGVFAGDFTLATAEAVCAGGGLERTAILDLLGRLVDKSLVTVEDRDGGPRFHLLETIRQFAVEQLTASGARQLLQLRHLDWCLALAAEHDPMVAGNHRSLALLEAERDELRAALAFALAHDADRALLLATRLWRFWLDRGAFAEGNQWLEAALAAATPDTPLRLEALLASAGLALRRGDAEVFLGLVSEAVADYCERGDSHEAGQALEQHATLEQAVSESASAETLFSQALAMGHRLGDERLVASTRHASALVPWYRGRPAEAGARIAAALAELEALPAGPDPFFLGVTLGFVLLPEGAGGAPRMLWEETLYRFHRFSRDAAMVQALNNLAWAARSDGEAARARTLLGDALARARAMEDPAAEAATLAHLGHLDRSAGDFEPGAAALAESLALREALGDMRAISVSRVGLALLHGRAGDLSQARELFTSVLESTTDVDDAPGIAGTLMNWAVVEETVGELEQAARFYARSTAAWSRQRMASMAGWTQTGLADTLAALGDKTGAQAAREEARVLLAQAGDVRASAAEPVQSRRKAAPA